MEESQAPRPDQGEAVSHLEGETRREQEHPQLQLRLQFEHHFMCQRLELLRAAVYMLKQQLTSDSRLSQCHSLL